MARHTVVPNDAGYGERAWGTAESEAEVMVPTFERGKAPSGGELEPRGGHQ